MPRKTVRTHAESERDVTVRVDFYKPSDRDDHIRLESTLDKALLLPQNSRTLIVGRERIILCSLKKSGNLYEGEIARLRMTETPAIGDLQGGLEDIPLRPDQGIAERTAFLFDPTTQILAIHAIREAVSASRLAGFCDEVEATSEGYDFQPVIRKNTMTEFNHLSAIRKVEIKVSSVGAAAAAPSHDRESVKNYLRFREFANLEAETISITLGVGRKRNRGMVRDSARDLVKSLLDHKDSLAVETLQVSGKQNGDEFVLLDLLHGRVREEINIKVRGRSASYNKRAEAVAEAYEMNKDSFSAKTGK
jgi:hypothetical protein